MVTSAHEGENAAAFDQRLGAAWGTAVADVFPGRLVRFLLFGLRRHDEPDGVLLHVRRYHNIAADRFHPEDGFPVERGLYGDLFALDGPFDDAAQLFA